MALAKVFSLSEDASFFHTRLFFALIWLESKTKLTKYFKVLLAM